MKVFYTTIRANSSGVVIFVAESREIALNKIEIHNRVSDWKCHENVTEIPTDHVDSYIIFT